MSGASPQAPMRSCTGCNGRDEQASLARFTIAGDRLVWDAERRRPGRGAYLHLRRDCAAAFARRKPFVRSLRASVPRAERERFVAERSLS